jgi:hypothetical protein
MGKSLAVALCMPIGPRGVAGSTLLTVAGLNYQRALAAIIPATGHLITARNNAWGRAVKGGADRVLWMDADVSADANDLLDWIDKQENHFTANEKVGCIGTVVPLRRGGYNYSLDHTREVPLWLGLGLVYWHVPRVLAALARAGRMMSDPFRWIPPFGEDYEISDLLHKHGCWQAIDSTLATAHDEVGTWEGGAKPPILPGVDASIGKKRGK